MPCTARGIEFRPPNLASHGSRLKEPPRRNPTLSGSDGHDSLDQECQPATVWQSRKVSAYVSSHILTPYSIDRTYLELLQCLQSNQHLFPVDDPTSYRVRGGTSAHPVLRSYDVHPNYSRIIQPTHMFRNIVRTVTINQHHPYPCLFWEIAVDNPRLGNRGI